MRRLLILIILIATPFLLFSETTERIITGIKKPDSIPNPFAVIDVYGPEHESIVNNSRIIISDVMRNQSYNAFSWVFTGNCYTAVNLKYTFSPLTCNPVISEATEDEIIPYTVTVSHESTTSGGKAITSTRLASGQGIQGDFGSYYYCLGEYVKYNNNDNPVTLTVSGTASQSVTLTYNFKSNSDVQTKRGNNWRNVDNYTQSVCCLWTRTGSASIVLKMTEDGFSIPEGNSDPIRFSDGEYTCNVVVEITYGS